MIVSVPLLVAIVIGAVVVGLLLGRRRQGGVIRPEPAVRVIRPPVPPVPASGVGDPAAAGALAEAINRAGSDAHLGIHITPEMLANAKITSNVHVSSSEGTLDPASARQVMDAVSRMMAAGGSGVPGQLSPEIEREVRALIGQGKMINAVKLVHDTTGLDLRDSKNIVDALR